MKRALQMGRGCKQDVSHASYVAGSDSSFLVPFSLHRTCTFQPGTSLGKMAGLNRYGWISDHRHFSQKMKTKEISRPQKWDRWPGDNWQAEGWGTQHSFCLSFYWQLLFPHLLRPWISRPGEWKVQGQVGRDFEHTVLSPLLLFPLCQLYCWASCCPFGQWPTLLAVSLSYVFATLSLLTGIERKLWCCASTAQQ